ncbi:hypothetical protein SAMN05421858_4219 [Haladaptatus litoreus]|uniref:Uncharacterized protein n=1 Tax=Haladaptatus litoreus TaxID=553468 RepID=A0A1N7EGG7_9EURY|nr:hypothetical protein [Haladaptatus litoreus]SIR87191.1 hypothetical protein SAMN05421858_4219 [Haladaptatus litoreus]
MSDPTTSGATTLENVLISDLAKHVQSLSDRIDDLEEEVTQKDERIDELEQRVDTREDKAAKAKAHRNAIARKTQSAGKRIDELQAREFEKGAHLLADNVDKDRIFVEGNKLERITKDDGETYFRLPGEDDALGRGGAVAHSTADLLPLQRLARYDDEMLASVTNRKPDELAAKVWRERDDSGRYSLWSKGSGEIRAYLDASDLAEWFRLKESGVSKKYSQELARRTIDAMHELSNGRLGKIKRQRSKDGLRYQETRLVLKSDVELPGEVTNGNTDDSPATDGVAGK